jgi:DNA-binding NtrC family response regulator
VTPEVNIRDVSAVAPPVVGPTSDSGAEDHGPLALDELEKRHILSVLKQTGGNRTQAANGLGISIRTLRNKLSTYRKQGEAIEGD